MGVSWVNLKDTDKELTALLMFLRAGNLLRSFICFWGDPSVLHAPHPRNWVKEDPRWSRRQRPNTVVPEADTSRGGSFMGGKASTQLITKTGPERDTTM